MGEAGGEKEVERLCVLGWFLLGVWGWGWGWVVWGGGGFGGGCRCVVGGLFGNFLGRGWVFQDGCGGGGGEGGVVWMFFVLVVEGGVCGGWCLGCSGGGLWGDVVVWVGWGWFVGGGGCVCRGALWVLGCRL